MWYAEDAKEKMFRNEEVKLNKNKRKQIIKIRKREFYEDQNTMANYLDLEMARKTAVIGRKHFENIL